MRKAVPTICEALSMLPHLLVSQQKHQRALVRPSHQDRQQLPKNAGTFTSIFLLVVIQKDAQHVKASPGNHMVHIALLCLDIV